MREFTFSSEQWLPRPPPQGFNFFSDAFNLEAITPGFLRFEVLTPRPIQMRAGTLIDYKLRIRGFPIRWRTLISAWEPPYRFVDKQLRGPYRQWIHEHTFEEIDGGTLMRDKVSYAVLGGALVEGWLVRPDIEKIFAHRTRQIEALLPGPART